MNRQVDGLFVEPPDDVDKLARNVIGAAIEVHRHLGPGFLESVYEHALAVELRLRGIAFARQKAIPVTYKGFDVGVSRPDFLVDEKLVVEVKAVGELAPIHQAQVISYLKALRQPLGLLLNFKVGTLKAGGIRRVALNALKQLSGPP